MKKAAGGIGDIAKFAAPALNFIPGVGPIAAAGIGAAGGALGQLNNKNPSLGSALRDAALSGGAAYGVGAAKGARGGVGGALSGAANWLGDPKAGAQRMAGLTGLIGAGTGIVAGQQAQGAQNEQSAYERQRQSMYDPQRAAILDLFMKRLGGGAASPAAVRA